MMALLEVKGPAGAAPLPIDTKGAAAPRREAPPFSGVGTARRRRPTPRASERRLLHFAKRAK
jgi:hypothetical protein